MTTIIGSIAGILTTIAIIPQILKVIKTREVHDISSKFLIILIAGLGLWVLYGILSKDWPIILTNGVSFILNTIMIAVYYSHKKL